MTTATTRTDSAVGSLADQIVASSVTGATYDVDGGQQLIG
jgi:hypothetical protein